MPSPAEAVNNYILAKDGNRPFLMRQTFSEDVALEMVVKTDAISFPSTATGLSAVEDVLVRRFGVEYENIYMFCLSHPSETDRARFQCHWLVGMSARATGQPLRVGCGRYDWHFNQDGKVVRLVITIEVMKILSGTQLDGVMRWLSSLPYPWCSPAQALMSFPAQRDLLEVEAYLKQAQ
ncbi:hypothetical protein Q3C01_09130 [Bradyrhizobium sp. UFLA05-109]